jgi:hypothetical protein
MRFETKNLDGGCLKWSKTHFQRFFVFGECNFYAFWGHKLFFLVFMGGFFEFLGGPELNFKDFSCLNTFMGALAHLYYYYNAENNSRQNPNQHPAAKQPKPQPNPDPSPLVSPLILPEPAIPTNSEK